MYLEMILLQSTAGSWIDVIAIDSVSLPMLMLGECTAFLAESNSNNEHSDDLLTILVYKYRLKGFSVMV